MKTLFLFALIFASVKLSAQDPKTIIKKAIAKCNSIENGYYEMTVKEKNMGGHDTSEVVLKSYFKKTNNDKTSSALFNTSVSQNNIFLRSSIYTGLEYVTLEGRDSSGTIISNSKWNDEVKSRIENTPAYIHVLDEDNNPLPRHFKEFTMQYLGMETIMNIPCYHIQVNVKTEHANAPKQMTLLRDENHFWIDRDNFLPIQYSTAIDMFMNNDTMYQYERTTLTKYSFNDLHNDGVFKLDVIPSFFTLTEYTPFKLPEPLALQTAAPDWTLSSTSHQTVTLHDLKGQLVLLDFSYKGCYGCMLALPVIESLYKKYHDKGLTVLGMDPYDKDVNELTLFMNKRGVTYPILMANEEVLKNYRVKTSPYFFLIDTNGNIIYSSIGYNEQLESKLDARIQQNLPR